MVINTLLICAVINIKLHNTTSKHNQHEYAILNKWVFNLDLNSSGDGDSLISSGILFHRRGAAAWKDSAPNLH